MVVLKCHAFQTQPGTSAEGLEKGDRGSMAGWADFVLCDGDLIIDICRFGGSSSIGHGAP